MAQDTTLGPDQTVPANVAEAAASAGLGSFVRAFVPKRRNWFLLIFNLIIGLAMAVFLIGLWLIWVVLRTPNFSRSLAARRVYLYEHGFVITERPDDPQVYRWDAIDTVFQKIVSQRSYGIEVAKNYLYTITRRDGRVLKLTQFWADIDKLGPHVNNSVSQALLPGAGPADLLGTTACRWPPDATAVSVGVPTMPNAGAFRCVLMPPPPRPARAPAAARRPAAPRAAP